MAGAHRLQRFEKTNAKLAMFNESSETHLATATHQFKRHTQLLLDAKKDLNAIFRRIRSAFGGSGCPGAATAA